MVRLQLILAVILFNSLVFNHLYCQIISPDLANGRVRGFFSGSHHLSSAELPLAGYEVDGQAFTSDGTGPVSVEILTRDSLSGSSRIRVRFSNEGKDTLRISNVLPFGRDDKRVYITGKGDHRLSRAHLFLPGRLPVNVILPDNAWELGYSAVS